jgi:predicted membrane channel-forming protein YqfA (hemolysin III family)
MSAGLVGLALSFTALIRDRWGSLAYLLAGIVLLIVGATLYWITSRKRTDDIENHERPSN